MENLDCEWHWQQTNQYQTWYDLRWINYFILFIVGGAKTWHKAYYSTTLMVIFFHVVRFKHGFMCPFIVLMFVLGKGTNQMFFIIIGI